MLFIKSAKMFMAVIDEYGLLAEDEVVISLSTTTNNSVQYLNQNVIITRIPCYLIGDIRLVKAVPPPPQLSHLVNCIIFPKKSSSSPPLQEQILNGSLGGDFYWVCTEHMLFPEKNAQSELNYKTYVHDHHLKPAYGPVLELIISDMKDHFIKTAERDELGILESYLRSIGSLKGIDSSAYIDCAGRCAVELGVSAYKAPVEITASMVWSSSINNNSMGSAANSSNNNSKKGTTGIAWIDYTHKIKDPNTTSMNVFLQQVQEALNSIESESAETSAASSSTPVDGDNVPEFAPVKRKNIFNVIFKMVCQALKDVIEHDVVLLKRKSYEFMDSELIYSPFNSIDTEFAAKFDNEQVNCLEKIIPDFKSSMDTMAKQMHASGTFASRVKRQVAPVNDNITQFIQNQQLTPEFISEEERIALNFRKIFDNVNSTEDKKIKASAWYKAVTLNDCSCELPLVCYDYLRDIKVEKTLFKNRSTLQNIVETFQRKDLFIPEYTPLVIHPSLINKLGLREDGSKKKKKCLQLQKCFISTTVFTMMTFKSGIHD